MEDMAELVKGSLDRLPVNYRLPVWLHHYEGLPFEAVAVALSESEVNVRSQASRGISMLRQMLEARGVAVSAVAILEALPLAPAESAPAGLFASIEKIVQGLGELGGAPAGLAGGSGGAFAGGKLALAVGVVLAAAGIGAGILTLSQGKTQPPPAASAVGTVRAPGGGILFRDDFEAGLDRWRIDTANAPSASWQVVEGKGVGNSRCLRVVPEPNQSAAWLKGCTLDYGGEYELDFDFLVVGSGSVLCLGLQGPGMLFWKQVDVARVGTWRHARVTWRKGLAEYREDGDPVPNRQGFQTDQGPGPARLIATRLHPGAELYIDNVVVRRLPEGTAAAGK
jgi:hypothetical protein